MGSTGFTPKPTIHVYKEIKVEKYKTTNHYQIDAVTNGKQILSDLLNINLDRQFAKSAPKYWLSTRDGNKWQRLTGLFKTPYSYFYKGDKGQNNLKHDLIICQLSEDKSTLIVYYYKDYYTNDFERVIKSIKQTL
ncbi:hypothetical protein [Flavobacterium luteum]|uniref:Uncharacterized protein n=1 Tax=Flavobacterium luteum TaxID=2026654 RepID=A0A7J5AH08_9FLAO|nr:hypothetical protein [Flavobacterium luteum]KAB1156881.1 hypothetical protein F6464_05885 [Flavobacterium luteum]